MLEIFVTSGAGEGSTELSAFDAALKDAGIMDINIIKISSVIPPHSVVRKQKYSLPRELVGCIVPAVLSECYASTAGDFVYAGLGWALFEDNSGIFVEHHSSSEENLVRLLERSLADCVVHRNMKYKEKNIVIAGKKCSGLPVCAIACAVYTPLDLRKASYLCSS